MENDMRMMGLMRRPSVLSLHERLEADEMATGKGVCIGFIDVGFFTHPDLVWPTRRIKVCADVTRPTPLASDFTSPHVWGWHGTMTSCCASGSGYLSGGRYRGLAYASDAVLIKASIDGSVVGKHVASAIRFVLRHPELSIRVLNISLGVDDDDPDAADVNAAVEEATEAGVFVVAAVGNNPTGTINAPASSDAAFSVGGQLDQNTRHAGDDTVFPSTHGVTRTGTLKPDIIAPAFLLPAPMLPGTLQLRESEALFQLVGILEEAAMAYGLGGLTLVPADKRHPRDVETLKMLMDAVGARLQYAKYIIPGYQHVEGTSFSSAIAAGVAAQMLEVAPDLTPAQIRKGLISTAVPLPVVHKELQGAGVLAPREAVQWARRQAVKG